MNSEIIKTLAADAITLWARNHNESCFLSIKDGIVIASVPTEEAQKYHSTLIITQFSQNAGLSNMAWNIIGYELFKLYKKEIACQAPLKP